MTNRLDRLEERGLLTRAKSSDDGRHVLVTLTPAGRATVDAAVTDHADNERTIVAALSIHQQQQLVGLLRRLHAALEANPTPTPTSPDVKSAAGDE